MEAAHITAQHTKYAFMAMAWISGKTSTGNECCLKHVRGRIEAPVTNESNLRTQGMQLEVLFKDTFISFVSILMSILHLTPICNCSNMQTHILWFMWVLKNCTVWWASIPGLRCLNLCCHQGSHSFLLCGKELVWNIQEALREKNTLLFKNWMLHLKSLGVGSKVKS